MEQPIYLDYNATTPVDPEVADALIPYIRTHYGNPSSSYFTGRSNKEAIVRAREQVADLINAEPDEIYFTSCATESNNLSIRGIALTRQDRGRHIITSAIEHPAVIEVCRYLTTQGFKITYLPVDSAGRVNSADVENAIRHDTILISIMHANNEVGTIQPVREIADMAKKNNIVLHTDAAQSAGKIRTDVKELDAGLLTIAGHKLYAPKGIGALYIKNGLKIGQLLYGAGQERGLRPGTENVAYIVALGKACEIAKRDLDSNTGIMLSARNRLYSGLTDKLGDKVTLNGTFDGSLPNTLSLSFEGTEAHMLASVIGNEVFISTGSACHADSVEISPVLEAMGVEPKIAAGTVRISTGKYTTEEEADRAAEIIANAVRKLSTG
jgi:cysteine desulfurase